MHFLLAGWLILAQGVASSVPVTKPADARIEGNVTRTGTGEPVYGATVDLRQYISPQPVDKTTTADRQGHFAFPNLAAGQYQLSAFAGGFTIQHKGNAAQNITLTEGQARTDLSFQMTPTATATGRVFDADNQPLTGATVELLQVAYNGDGERQYQVFEQVRTDDLGEYRLFWITPGRYYLRVDYGGQMPIRAAVSPNEYSGPRPYYAPTYYPNTVDIASASLLDLQPGGEEDAIDVRMTTSKTYTIKGRAISAVPGTTTARGVITLQAQRLPGLAAFGQPPANAGNARLAADGSFEIKNVVPGQYDLNLALVGNPGTNINSRIGITRSVTVGEGDVEGIQIVLTPPFDIPGQIVYEGMPATPPSPTQPRPRLIPVGDTGARTFGGLLGPTQVNADGSFVLPQTAAGTYHLNFSSVSPDSYVKSITLDTIDVLQNGLTLSQAPDNPLQVVISYNGGHLDGTTLDKNSQPLGGQRVYLVPSDRSRGDLYKATASNATGKFTFRGLTPGVYKLFCWDSIENNAYRNPDFLNLYEDRGVSVTVTEGQNSPVEVHLIPQ